MASEREAATKARADSNSGGVSGYRGLNMKEEIMRLATLEIVIIFMLQRRV